MKIIDDKECFDDHNLVIDDDGVIVKNIIMHVIYSWIVS